MTDHDYEFNPNNINLSNNLAESNQLVFRNEEDLGQDSIQIYLHKNQDGQQTQLDHSLNEIQPQPMVQQQGATNSPLEIFYKARQNSKKELAQKFKKALYKMIQTKIQPWQSYMISVFSKQPDQRTVEDQRAMLPYFKVLNQFREIGIPDSDLMKVILQIELKVFAKDQVLFRTGDEPDNFYIVVHGEINLNLPNPAYRKIQNEMQTVERKSQSLVSYIEALKNTPNPNQEQILELCQELQLFQKKQRELGYLLEMLPEEIYQTTFKDGESFGELSFMKAQGRAGTCISNQSTICIAMNRDVYVKTVRRIHQEKLFLRMRFLKQIQFIKVWHTKHVNIFNSMLQVQEVQLMGTIVLEEGKLNSKVIIVKSGEFEVTKHNLTQVFMNPQSGMIKIKLSNNQEVISNKVNESQRQNQHNNAKPFYVGSELEYKINDYLDCQIREDESVAEKLRSVANQKFYNELSLGIVGVGQIFGEVDAWHQRRNIYTLKSKLPGSSYFFVDSLQFKTYVEEIEFNGQNFKKYCSQSEQRWADKLAFSINMLQNLYNKKVEKPIVQKTNTKSSSNIESLVQHMKFLKDNSLNATSQKTVFKSRLCRKLFGDYQQEQESQPSRKQKNNLIKNVGQKKQVDCHEQHQHITTRTKQHFKLEPREVLLRQNSETLNTSNRKTVNDRMSQNSLLKFKHQRLQTSTGFRKDPLVQTLTNWSNSSKLPCKTVNLSTQPSPIPDRTRVLSSYDSIRTKQKQNHNYRSISSLN